jgi:3-keto-5-aminohexanoate cleavage enzyme
MTDSNKSAHKGSQKGSPVVLSCCLVGAELTRETYPPLPLTPDEIAAAAEEAVKAGASIIHLHVRDEQGHPTQRVDVFETVTRKIKERCDCILQYSTGGAVGTPLAERCAPLALKPEMATLSMGTMNFGSEVYENTEHIIREISAKIQDSGAMAELEIFDLGMWDTTERFLKKGYLPKKFHVDFVLGVPGGAMGEIRNLVYLVDRLPADQTWSVAGVGRYQLPLAAHALAMGGHVRVGIEDNIFYRKGELATSNAQLVARVARLANELERPVASAAEARKLLQLT